MQVRHSWSWTGAVCVGQGEVGEGWPLLRDLDEAQLEVYTSISLCIQLLSCLHQNSFVKPQCDTMPGAVQTDMVLALQECPS